MDSEVKAKWTAALRSGKYRQGANYLRAKGPDQDNFCCLGVLCELAVEAEIIPPPVRNIEDIYEYGPDESMSYLPAQVRRWAGLPDAMGGFHSNGELPFNSLTEMNDNEYSFEEIAPVIEEKF